ncbi:MAG: sulfotransferase domain-containing protein [Chitinophagales bacterium]|nr:sulfotransferase domain-containing protein [Chitinophagales bacterium]
MNSSKLPNLIIGGVHKAGTTSVFTYLSLHSEVCGSTSKEIGFFMPLKYGKEIPPLSEYEGYFSHCNINNKYRLEASPSYLYGKEVIAHRIKKELGSETKILFIFRNPSDRLFSFYERKKANAYLGEKISFSEFIKKSQTLATEEMDDMREDEEALFIRGIKEGFYIDYLPCWFEIFGSNLKVLFFEDLKEDTPAFMEHLCNWLGLDFNLYKPDDFKIENQTIGYKNRWMHSTMLGVNKKFESFWRKNVGLKRTLRNLYKKINASESKREKMNIEERNYLETLYVPYNKRLADFLRKRGITQFPAWLN